MSLTEQQAPQAKSKKKNVIPVKVGAVSVPIYRPKTEGGRWLIVWRMAKGAPRQRTTRATLAEAREFAEDICLKILRGQVSSAQLSPDELLQAGSALQLLPANTTLDAVVRDLVESHKITGGAGIMEMARFWARHHAVALSRRTVDEVHAELLAAKGDAALSEQHIRELTRDLGHFVQAFSGRPIAEIDASHIREYLRTYQKERAVGWRRRNKLRDLAVELFRFARRERHLPEDRDTEAEKVEKLPKPRNAPLPDVFSPEELRIILGRARPEWLASVAIGAFAGLRAEERQRMNWEKHVLWEERLIHVDESVAKHTGRRRGDVRYVPIRDNLYAWLEPIRQETGPLCRLKAWDQEVMRLSPFLPEGWRKNGLRHSWVSYREAERDGDLKSVAEEAGNSAAIAKLAYLNPRMVRQARAWFGIFPEATKPGNIIEMA